MFPFVIIVYRHNEPISPEKPPEVKMEVDHELEVESSQAIETESTDDILESETTLVKSEITDNTDEIHAEAVKDSSEELNNNNAVKMEIDHILKENPYAKLHGFSNEKKVKDESDEGDSALGSSDNDDNPDAKEVSTDDQIAEETPLDKIAKAGLRPGDVVWTFWNKFYPGIVSESQLRNGKNQVTISYFNWDGIAGVVKFSSVYKFGTADELKAELKARRDPRKFDPLRLTPAINRGIEEAKIFAQFPEHERIEIFRAVLRMQSGLKHKKTIDDSTIEAIEELRLKESITKYAEQMKKFDELAALELKQLKLKQQERATIKLEAMEIKKEHDWMSCSETNSFTSTTPSTDCRQSDRIIKRRLTLISQSSRESTPVESPAPKKRRISTGSVKEVLPVTERFQFRPKDISAMFKSASTQPICLECCKAETSDAKVYKCLECSEYFHEQCAHQADVEISQIKHKTGDSDKIFEKRNVKLICKACHRKEKLCFICRESIGEANSHKCDSADCKKVYHRSCLDKCKQSKNNNSSVKSDCPQHACHTCLWKKTNRNGAIVKVINPFKLLIV